MNLVPPHIIAPWPKHLLILQSRLWVGPDQRAFPSKETDFAYVTASPKPPFIGYIVPAGLHQKAVPAIRVEISGTLRTDVPELQNGSLSISFGYLRESSIAGWNHRFSFGAPWVRQCWNRIRARVVSLKSRGCRYVTEGFNWDLGDLDPARQPNPPDYYPFLDLTELATDRDRRCLAAWGLYLHWCDHDSILEWQANDLLVLGFGKRPGGRQQGGNAVGGKLTRGAISIIRKRAGLP